MDPADEAAPKGPSARFTFSREIRGGELLTALSIIGGAVTIWTTLNAEVANIKQAQQTQAQVNRELREDIRGVAVEIKQDIRELRQEVRARTRM